MRPGEGFPTAKDFGRRGDDYRMNSDYNDVFSLEGPLQRALPGYAFRPEQAVMAKAVGLALARLEPLIVEAGTGTGKTFAYLVPALLSGAQCDHFHRHSHASGPAVPP